MFNVFQMRWRRMANWAFSTSLVALLVLVLTGMGCERKPKAPPGTPAPVFELKDSLGKPHRLEDMRGNIVLLHFWASWCPPCLEEIPKWLAASDQFRELPVKMVAISVDEQWSEALKILPQEDVPANMVSLLDPDSSVAKAYGTSLFPESYLLDTELRVVEKWIGIIDWKSPRVRFAVNKALIKSPKPNGPGESLPKKAPAP